jgi:hypothetical protein
MKAASLELGIRQAKRVYQRYLEGGDEALSYDNQGNRRTDPELVQQALTLYADGLRRFKKRSRSSCWKKR